jgi:hypothetical protein
MGNGNAEPVPPPAAAPTKRNRIVPERDASANPGEKPVSKSKGSATRLPNEQPPAPHTPLSLPAPTTTTGPTARLPYGAVQGSSALALGMMSEVHSASWEADPENAPHLYDEDQEQDEEAEEDSEVEEQETGSISAEASEDWSDDEEEDEDDSDDEDDEDEEEDDWNDEDEDDDEDDE